MSISYDYYGTLEDAETYFENRLHEFAWTNASDADKPKALLAARLIIDTLNYKGRKATVFAVLEADPEADNDTIREAEASQPLEFPRGSDTDVPDAIIQAQYEIAHSLLDGVDPELELQNLGIISNGLSSVRTTYNRTQVPIAHIVNGVPNALAWRLIMPFLRDEDAVKLARIS